jgi:cell division protein FtsB
VRGILLIPAVLGMAVVYAALDRDQGIGRWRELRGDLREVRAHILELERENQALQERTDRLREEPFALESAIREDLELVRPGELLVRLPSREVSNGRFP